LSLLWLLGEANLPKCQSKQKINKQSSFRHGKSSRKPDVMNCCLLYNVYF
jgi:hypothetical protein